MRLWLKAAIIISLLTLALLFATWTEYQRFITTPLSIGDKGLNYTVKAGSNLKQISRDIGQLGLTEFPAEYLRLYGRLQQKSHLIKAGEFHIPTATTLPQLLDLLVAGKVIQYQFTIIEGMTSQQLIDAVSADPRLIKTLESSQLNDVMTQMELTDHHGEGEFAPETYNFTAGTTDIELLRRAHKMMTVILNNAWQNRADDLPYKSAYEALIMASIIEKESGIAEERPQIAGVFVRRLNMGMRLQTDPTVIYGMGPQFDGNIRRKDLRRDTAYNTYTRYGLPPSPIALPSKAAIEAALHPKAGKSLYFVATGHEGRHIFSNTLVAHNRAVRKYQLKR